MGVSLAFLCMGAGLCLGDGKCEGKLTNVICPRNITVAGTGNTLITDPQTQEVIFDNRLEGSVSLSEDCVDCEVSALATIKSPNGKTKGLNNPGGGFPVTNGANWSLPGTGSGGAVGDEVTITIYLRCAGKNGTVQVDKHKCEPVVVQ